MNEPTLLLCDEPTGNLDTDTGRQVGDLLKELAEETDAILIVVTHSRSLAGSVGRQMRLEHGQLRA
jgi:putative ABC transport system ATP-binding protein